MPFDAEWAREFDEIYGESVYSERLKAFRMLFGYYPMLSTIRKEDNVFAELFENLRKRIR